MNVVAVISTWFLAAVFLFAGIDKAFHYDGFVNALRSYALIPELLAAPLAPAVILVELWVGLGLLLRSWRQRAALTGAAVLGVFTLALAVNQWVAPGSICGCWFTVTLAQSSGMHIVQNLVLFGLSLTVWWQMRSGGLSDGSTRIVHEASSASI
ncbi:MAG: MauE/DoxX family redox-associated membrane protein [Thermoanaerobaculia bacterium]